MIKYSDRIYYWEPVEMSDRPVVGYINGDKYSLLFDAGNSEKHASEILNSIRQNKLMDPNFIVISHKHLDHWFGLSVFNAISICSLKSLHGINERILQKWDSNSVQKRVKNATEKKITEVMLDIEYGKDRGEIKLVAPSIGISNSIVIDLGGVHCRYEYFGGTHSDDSSVLYIEEEKLLFLGDILYNRVNDKKNIDELYIKIKSYDARYYIDSHDEKIYKNEDLEYFIQELRTK